MEQLLAKDDPATYEYSALKEVITIDHAVEYLNELISTDRTAMGALINNRVPCNEQLANHPTVQARAQHDGYLVGMLGVINGMFGVDNEGWGQILFVYEDDSLARVERKTAGVNMCAEKEN